MELGNFINPFNYKQLENEWEKLIKLENQSESQCYMLSLPFSKYSAIKKVRH